MNIQSIEIARITAAPYNPRVVLQPGDAEYDRLTKSLDSFGCVEPLVWNVRTGHLVGGHQRLAVLKARGDARADVSVVDLSLEQEKALNLALNRITGRWDETKLAALLDELIRVPELDLEVTGFDLDEAGDLIRGILGHATAPEEDFDLDAALAACGPPVTQPGELITLGAHRLLCGDCTDAAQVQQLMGEERAALFATDPPYGVAYDGTNHPGTDRHKARAKLRSQGAPSAKPAAAQRAGFGRGKDWSETYAVTWDDDGPNEELYEGFVKAAVDHALQPDAAWYCWHASRNQAMVERVWQRHGAFVHCQIIWVKNRPVLTRSWYAWKHEPCFFGWRRPPLGCKPPRRVSGVPSTVWEIDTIANGQERPDHPTPKPLEVFEIPMRQHTKRGEICYEPFAGSGTQFIAAERLGRRCFGMEINPVYCDLIVRRFIAFAGAAAVPSKLAERYHTPLARELVP